MRATAAAGGRRQLIAHEDRAAPGVDKDRVLDEGHGVQGANSRSEPEVEVA